MFSYLLADRYFYETIKNNVEHVNKSSRTIFVCKIKMLK